MATDTPGVTTRLRDCIAEILPDLVAIRHDLHRHPELMYEEHRTSGVVQDQLKQAGVSFVADLAGGTGVLGHLPGQSEQATGFRADMDALPIHETTGLEWASTIDGKMHACGHDGHTTILIGAARVLATLAAEGDLPHPVSFMFQPAEEGGAGGLRMVEDGCLDGRVIGPPMERLFGLHGWPMLPEGAVGSRPGPMLAAADRFCIEIHGRGGHAAMPHTTRDPVAAAASVITTLQQVVSRHVDPVMGGVISVTMINAGSAFNVIPETCTLQGTVRALHAEAHEILRSSVCDIPGRIAEALGCTATVTYNEGYPVTRNDEAMTAHFHDIARETLGDSNVQPLEFPVMGAEDFSYYCEIVPACFFGLGLCPTDQDEIPGLHHPNFDFNDRTIATGVELFCRLALS
ncbi:MAG: amidohydrolase [Phycisphaerales bacterium]|nr:amidohydrolase [Phycisphaerales bacterium]